MYELKDSGQKRVFASGHQRDADEGKIRYDLIPMEKLKLLAELYTRGAEKYGARNWELANSGEEYLKFKEKALRHFMQWFNNENKEEDHVSQTIFNMWGADKTKDKMQ